MTDLPTPSPQPGQQQQQAALPVTEVVLVPQSVCATPDAPYQPPVAQGPPSVPAVADPFAVMLPPGNPFTAQPLVHNPFDAVSAVPAQPGAAPTAAPASAPAVGDPFAAVQTPAHDPFAVRAAPGNPFDAPPVAPTAAPATAPPAAPTPTAAPTASDGIQDVYRVKEIVFPDKLAADKRVRVVLQNANGPCPLLAICNVLALRGELVIPLQDTVTFGFLSERLGEYLVSRSDALGESATVSPTSGTPRPTLDDALRLIPGLVRGLDVNVRFDGIASFGDGDPEAALFQWFNIRLVHGWTVDPQDAAVWAVLGTGGTAPAFNDAAVLACDEDSPAGGIVRAFFRDSPSQLTVHGLISLATALPDALYALFYNNHFFTLYKRADGALYTLVTDVGYAEHPEIVWETLASMDGDSVLVDGGFVEVPPAVLLSAGTSHDAEERPLGELYPAGARPGGAGALDAHFGAMALGDGATGEGANEQADRDFAIALAMQQEEDDAARRAATQAEVEAAAAAAGIRTRPQQHQYQDQAVQPAQPTGPPAHLAGRPRQSRPEYADEGEYSPQGGRKRKEKSKDKDCVIM
ncbi:hypothetical protein H9P43_009198 [Blastocladiella emersonii ATCC 22665]|nr:hypothetical protein H9P43_009198 [Blastocladiella emersonii ATCC 22665]